MAYLKLKTCSAIKKHFLALTGVEAQIHRTDAYLVINYVRDGSLSTIKVGLPGRVLYCLQESDLAPVIEAMRGAPK